MSHITIRRRHKLGHAELLDRVSHLAGRLSEKYGADCRWEGETVYIEHSNVTGTVEVSKSEVVVDARLGFFLSMFHERVEEEITKILDEELERKV
ncbi:MAG: polyhydroxyalkanoic acid system protein [Proteobacteria bacterium]|nr:polyhydroxyalkanoic acid system protein [Pseudomonadota bacterium]